ncbi:MAG: rRNA maturation RNase YbeY [Bacteroidales bacterium]
MTRPIQFFREEIPFILKDKIHIRRWLDSVILEEKKKPWYINIILTNDEYLFELNKTYLQHETFTDILTFPYQEEDKNIISGDIFISINRVKENASIFKQDFEMELRRVMVHGVLHLIGYNDKGKKEKELMTKKEDYYLEKFNMLEQK